MPSDTKKSTIYKWFYRTGRTQFRSAQQGRGSFYSEKLLCLLPFTINLFCANIEIEES